MKNIIRFLSVAIIIALSGCYCNDLKAQYLNGTTGLMNIPTADMQPDGTFMVGANYMPSEITPSYWSDDTANYFFNVTFLPFLELGYLCTFKRLSNNTINQDRAISVRLRALKEANWYPSIVFGSGDITTTNQNGDITQQVSGNNYYSGIYGVATKHFIIAQEQIGVTIGYSYDIQDRSYNDSVFCGVSYRPSFYTDCEFMADMKSEKVSVGAAVKLFNHLSINVFYYDFKAFSAGLRYEIKLY